MIDNKATARSTVSVVGGSFKSIEEIAANSLKKAAAASHLSAVHCEALTTMRGLIRFPGLKTLTLSGNNLSRMEFLDSVPALVKLDLSANRITAIENLSTLKLLEVIELSGNHISSIEGLTPLAGDDSKLKEVYLAGNQIFDVRELKLLSRFTSLNRIVFEEDDDNSNPVCLDKSAYYSYLDKYCPEQLEVDKRDRRCLKQAMQSTAVKSNSGSVSLKWQDETLQKENQYLKQQLQKVDCSKADDTKKWSAILAGKEEQLTAAINNKRELMSRLELSQAKTKKMTQDYREMERLAKNSASEVTRLKEEMVYQEQRLEHIMANNSNLNATLQAGLARSKQLEERISVLEIQNSTLLATVTDYEQHIGALQARTVNSASQSIEQYQSILTRVRDVESQKAKLSEELDHERSLRQRLETRLAELESLPPPLSESQLEDLLQIRLRPLIESRLGERDREHEEAIMRLKQSMAEDASAVDKEYASVLTELQRRESSARDDLISHQSTIRSLRSSIEDMSSSLHDRDALISDMTSLLSKAKHDIGRLKHQSSIDADRHAKAMIDMTIDHRSTIDKLTDDNRRLMIDIESMRDTISANRSSIDDMTVKLSDSIATIADLRSSNIDLMAKQSTMMIDIDRLTSTISDMNVDMTSMIDRLDDRSIKLSVMTDQLTDKDRQLSTALMTIDRLTIEKHRIESISIDRQSTVDDKYRRMTALYDQLEDRCRSLESTNMDIESTNKSLTDRIDRLTDQLKAKNDDMRDLMAAVERKETDRLMKDRERLTDNDRYASKLKDQESMLQRREDELARAVHEIDKKYREVMADNEVKDREIRSLLTEIDRQKATAKDNIAKLAKMFN